MVITTQIFYYHLHPLQVENCGSNSRLVADEDDNKKSESDYLLSVTNCTNISQLLLKIRLLLEQHPLVVMVLIHGNYILSGHHLHVRNIRPFNMEIPLKILILYVITCVFSWAFTRLTTWYIGLHVHNTI